MVFVQKHNNSLLKNYKKNIIWIVMIAHDNPELLLARTHHKATRQNPTPKIRKPNHHMSFARNASIKTVAFSENHVPVSPIVSARENQRPSHPPRESVWSRSSLTVKNRVSHFQTRKLNFQNPKKNKKKTPKH